MNERSKNIGIHTYIHGSRNNAVSMGLQVYCALETWNSILERALSSTASHWLRIPGVLAKGLAWTELEAN